MRRVRKTESSPSLSTLARQEIVAAKRGQRPQIPDDPDWSLRRAPPDDEFERRKQKISGKGLLCKVLLWTSGNNAYPENPLIGLKVIPLEQAVTNAPALHTKVWHISVAFKDPIMPAWKGRSPKNIKSRKSCDFGFLESDTMRSASYTTAILSRVIRLSKLYIKRAIIEIGHYILHSSASQGIQIVVVPPLRS